MKKKKKTYRVGFGYLVLFASYQIPPLERKMMILHEMQILSDFGQ